MKGIVVLGLSIISTVYGCSYVEEKQDEKKVSYLAVNKDDTATLNLKLTDKDFYGQYEINYHGYYKDSGGVTGVIKGDTLKGTYRFRHYGIEKWHRKPIVLLKRDGKLILGKGDMELFMNMLYFKKNTAISYQNPDFVFSLIP